MRRLKQVIASMVCSAFILGGAAQAAGAQVGVGAQVDVAPAPQAGWYATPPIFAGIAVGTTSVGLCANVLPTNACLAIGGLTRPLGVCAAVTVLTVLRGR